MSLRAHLDEETLAQLRALSTAAAKPRQKRQLPKAPKATKDQPASAQQPAPGKPNTAKKQPRSKPTRKGRLAQAAQKYTLAADASQALGLTLRQLWDACQRMQYTVHRGTRDDYLKASDVEALRTHLLERGHQVEMRVVARLKRVDLPAVQRAAANLRLATATNAAGQEAIRFQDYESLLEELTRILEARANHQLESLGTSWESDGTPLKRHEDMKIPPKQPKKPGQFVQVVSGGLPTLGAGHK